MIVYKWRGPWEDGDQSSTCLPLMSCHPDKISDGDGHGGPWEGGDQSST